MAETPKIEPAMDAEDWAEHLGPNTHDKPDRLGVTLMERIVGCDICFGQYSRHERAAMCLYGQPYGFTDADVALLVSLAKNPDLDRFSTAYPLLALASRIAALLPPAVTHG